MAMQNCYRRTSFNHLYTHLYEVLLALVALRIEQRYDKVSVNIFTCVYRQLPWVKETG